MTPPAPAPVGFAERRTGARWSLIRADLEGALLAGVLHDPVALTAPRGTVIRVEGPDGPLVIRSYRRGGWLGPLELPHASVERFRRELTISVAARRRGVPVPEVVGVAALRCWPGWRGFVVMREIPRARDLRAALADAGDGEGARALLERALAAVRRAHDAGLAHPDLNLGNLLLDGDGAVWIVDLDRTRIGPPRSPRARFAEVSRLDRSIEKVFGGSLLDRASRDDLMLGYVAGDPASAAVFRAGLAAHARRLARHRLLWRGPRD